MTRVTAEEIRLLMAREFPAAASRYALEALDEKEVRLRWPTTDGNLRPGATISGPTMMTLADTAMYFLVLANVGMQPLAVTTNLNIHFLRKPQPGDLIARARRLKAGKRLVIGEVEIDSGEAMVAHATVTYSVPPR